MYRVLGEETLELGIQLSRQCLVVRQDQGGTPRARDDICHRERLARTRHAQQRLEGHAVIYAVSQLSYRLRLVSGWLIFTMQSIFHCFPFSTRVQRYEKVFSFSAFCHHLFR